MYLVSLYKESIDQHEWSQWRSQQGQGTGTYEEETVITELVYPTEEVALVAPNNRCMVEEWELTDINWNTEIPIPKGKK